MLLNSEFARLWNMVLGRTKLEIIIESRNIDDDWEGPMCYFRQRDSVGNGYKITISEKELWFVRFVCKVTLTPMMAYNDYFLIPATMGIWMLLTNFRFHTSKLFSSMIISIFLPITLEIWVVSRIKRAIEENQTLSMKRWREEQVKIFVRFFITRHKHFTQTLTILKNSWKFWCKETPWLAGHWKSGYSTQD